ncbi:hypothetical protein [Devosia riboflavina]
MPADKVHAVAASSQQTLAKPDMRMTPHRSDSIEIVLNHPGELFVAPVPDPFAGRFETRSGVEQLVRELTLDRAQRHYRPNIIFRIPAGSGVAGHEEAFEAALRGYCADRIADLDLDSQQLMSSGRHALLRGLGFLAACLALSGTLSNTSFMPEFIHRLLAEGFNIAGWVGLWRPVELLLYDTALPRRDRAVLRSLLSRQVRFIEG